MPARAGAGVFGVCVSVVGVVVGGWFAAVVGGGVAGQCVGQVGVVVELGPVGGECVVGWRGEGFEGGRRDGDGCLVEREVGVGDRGREGRRFGDGAGVDGVGVGFADGVRGFLGEAFGDGVPGERDEQGGRLGLPGPVGGDGGRRWHGDRREGRFDADRGDGWQCVGCVRRVGVGGVVDEGVVPSGFVVDEGGAPVVQAGVGFVGLRGHGAGLRRVFLGVGACVGVGREAGGAVGSVVWLEAGFEGFVARLGGVRGPGGDAGVQHRVQGGALGVVRDRFVVVEGVVPSGFVVDEGGAPVVQAGVGFVGPRGHGAGLRRVLFGVCAWRRVGFRQACGGAEPGFGLVHAVGFEGAFRLERVGFRRDPGVREGVQGRALDRLQDQLTRAEG